MVIEVEEYKKILDSMIKSSGLKLDEIAEKCKQKGVDITASYISKLRLGHRPAPDESISRAIAQVCNQDPEILIRVGNIEKTPLPIKEEMDRYKEVFALLTPAIIQLCNNDEFLDRVALSEGYKIPFDSLSRLLEEMTPNNLMEFITKLGFALTVEESNDGKTNLWLESTFDLSAEDKQPLNRMKEIILVNKDSLSSIYNKNTATGTLSPNKKHDIARNLVKNPFAQHRDLEVEQLAAELQTNPEYLELHRLMKNMPKKDVKEVLSFAKYKNLEGKDRGPDDEDDF